MKAKDAEEIRFDVICNIFGEDLAVTYNPMSIRCNEEQLSSDMMGLVTLVARTVTAWDLTEEDGRPVPITVDRLAELPFVLLNLICEQVLNDKDKRARRALQTMRGADATEPEGGERYAN